MQPNQFKNEEHIHKRSKSLFCSHFKNVNLEKYLPQSRQYIDIEINNKYAIEIQISHITIQNLQSRNNRYLAQNYIPIWILNNYSISKKGKYTYLTKFHKQFVTNILSNVPCLYTINIYEQKIYIYYNFYQIKKAKHICSIKKISLTEVIKFQNLNTIPLNHVIKRWHVKDFDLTELLIHEQIDPKKLSKNYFEVNNLVFFTNEELPVWHLKKKYNLKLKTLKFPLLCSSPKG